MNTHTITKTYKSEGGTATITAQTISGELSQNVEVEIPAGAVNKEIILSIPITTLLALAIAVTKKTGQLATLNVGVVTIKTNISATPDDTLIISTANGICWANGDDVGVTPKPLTVAVVKIFVSNTGDAIANLVVRALNDPTP